mmetsp:Transcript_17068/g.25842  ORF Transcript_17068/g.25842 Transcript_17068/m.25842 type:complete len:145 (-) Transcript_17068:1550-1984(-)
MESVQRTAEAREGNQKRRRQDCAATVIEVILSASKNGTAFRGQNLPVQQNIVPLESFFEFNVNIETLSYEIPKNVRSAIKSKYFKEERLRNAVYGDLKDKHGVTFLNSASATFRDVISRTLRSEILYNRRTDFYHETSLSSIFL